MSNVTELDRDSSERLNLIRFPLIVGVVFIHAYESVTQFGSTEAVLTPTSSIAVFTRDFISGGLASVAVPLFFFMSGFLFFYRLEWSGTAFFQKVRSRLKTLLVPFLFWNLLYLIIIAIAQNIPFTETYFAGGIPHVTQSEVFEYFNLIIGIDRHPIAFQFWYIRELMILVALTPLFHLMHKKTAFIFLALFFALWISDVWLGNVLSIVPSPLPVFFFYAGSVLAVKKRTPFLLDRYGVLMLVVCLALFSINAIFLGESFSPFMRKAGILVGVFSAFYATKFLLTNERVKSMFLWLGSASFFVFAFHEPLMGFFQRVVLKLYSPTSDVTKLLFYFAIPIIVIIVSILVYMLLSRTFPKFTALITGYRSSK